MSLFVVQHQHPAEGCPAGHPQMAPMLLQHLSEENAGQFGISIHGQAVIDGAHTFVMILDGPDQPTVENYMAPFGMVGSVEVKPANKCEAVVARAHC